MVEISGRVFIPLKGINYSEVTKVDAVDYFKYQLYRYKWKFNNGYAVRNIKKNNRAYTKVYMHRQITDNAHEITDHANRDKLDNTRRNLRSVTRQQNSVNRKMPSNKRFKGVSKSWVSRWKAVIVADKKVYHIGTYETEEEAAIEYNKKAKELFGEYANLNIVKDFIVKKREKVVSKKNCKVCYISITGRGIHELCRSCAQSKVMECRKK